MKLERISAVVHAGATRERPARDLVPGERLLLELSAADRDEMLASASNGTTLRLPGLRQALGELKPGDVLQVRVLASEPLELEVEGASTRRPDRGSDRRDNVSSFARQASMRLDQAALRQITWQAPDAAALAQSWRTLALARWGRPGNGPNELLEPHPAPAPTVLAQSPVREPVSVLPPAGLDRWQLPVYGWGGARIVLGLTAEEERDQPGGSRRQRSLRLSVALTPAALGEIVLHAQWSAQGFDLRIVVKDPASVSSVRQALPKIAERLMRAGIGLVYITLVHAQRIMAQVGTPTRSAAPSTVASLLSLLSFRALAEAVFVLLQITPETTA